MKMYFFKKRTRVLFFPIAALSLAISSAAYAQNQDAEESTSPEPEILEQSESPEPANPAPAFRVNIASPMEEMVILGRIQSAAGDIVLERMEMPVAVDIIGSELIGRLGDSSVASALRRLPGVTLVDGKYVYVRGLGERYSTTTLNGAAVPSPDLTRNVIPLDIFPTSIVKSLSVQKMASADMPAAFGGGAIDIRTTSVPDDFLFSIELGSGGNSDGGDFLTYSGGSDDRLGKDDGTRALSSNLNEAVSRYRGNFNNIRDIEGIDSDAAAVINRELALALNRNIDIKEESGEADIGAEINIGNVFDIRSDTQVGFLAGLSYDSSWRNTERTAILSGVLLDTGEPQDIQFEKRSTYNVSLTGSVAFGVAFGEDHSVETTSLFIRNTDDETSFIDKFDDDVVFTSNVAEREMLLRYEKRELRVNQIRGEHMLGYETRSKIGWDWLEKLDGLAFSWNVSDSEATTDIPNELNLEATVAIKSPFSLDTNNFAVSRNGSSAVYRFTDLEDQLDSNGWELALPMNVKGIDVRLSVGGEYWKKVRTYEQLQFGLGSVDPDAARFDQPSVVFSDENIINPEFGYEVFIDNGNDASYIASNKVDAFFGQFDLMFNDTWRIAGGARWEDYQQVGLQWNPLDFERSPLIPDNVEFAAYEPIVLASGEETNAIAQYFRNATLQDDDIYTSFALTYMRSGFWADDFQLRFGFSETTVRPDLREITDSNFIDPITDFLVFGNAGLIPSQIQNFDLRAEWYFSNDDNLTVSLFFKDLDNPIDVAERGRSEDDRALQVINTESAEITGIELEFLKSLRDVSDILEPFFLQGNVTILDTSTVVGRQALDATTAERPLAGASDSANLIVGFDSDDGKHAATVSYNWFGDRLFFAGRNGQEDVYEQAAGLLDMTYSFYPTNHFTVKAKAQNILDETIQYERGGIKLLEQTRGVGFSLSVQYEF